MTLLPEAKIVADLFRENDVRVAFKATPRKLVLLTTEELLDSVKRASAEAQLGDKVEIRIWTSAQALLGEKDVDSYVVLAPRQEEEILSALKASPSLYGFYRDFYPRAVCFCWNKPAPQGWERIDLGYAILSTPRSGSTLLAELMWLNGVGRPKEHLREPLVTALAASSAGPRLARFVEVISCYASYKGVLGTKIISHFADGVVGTVDSSAVLDFVRSLPDFRLIVIIRQNKVAQGLSAFRAQQSKTFHIRSADDLRTYKSDQVAYNYEEIAERYRWSVDEEDKFLHGIATFISRLGGKAPPLEVCVYEELEANLAPETARLLSFLGRPNPEPVVDVRIQKLADDWSEQLAERFVAEHTKRSGVPPIVAYDFRAKLREIGL